MGHEYIGGRTSRRFGITMFPVLSRRHGPASATWPNTSPVMAAPSVGRRRSCTSPIS
jgi:hypothetical protein